jgi:ribosomal protein S18 acetylase RimI-like enzyme
VQEAIAYFSAQWVTGFILWPAVDVNAAAWKADLAAQGFHYDANTPGMAVELARLPDSTPHAAGLVIRPVEDLATLRLWTRIHAAGFGMPPSTTGPIYDLLASLGADRPLRFYLGYLDGQPVAISTLFLESDVAGIYDVATLPEARRKGIGAAMTLAPLLAMREAGCRVGILQSSAMGYYVYLRLGFVTVCKMEHFFWPAHDHAENQ